MKSPLQPREILLVEDTAADVILITRSLRKANLVNEIVVANDGREALDYFEGVGRFEGRDTTVPPAVVLLDLKLPRLGGLEVLKYLREHEATQLLPVVILTSSDEEDDIVQALAGGANSYVRKPVEWTHFGEVVQQVGLYWVLVNEPWPRPRG